MLKPYFRFYWLALKEYLPERRRKRLRVAYLVVVFVVGGIVADFYGVPLVKPLKWAFNLLPASYWVIATLLAVIIFKSSIIEGARRVHERTIWLQDLAKTDHQNIGAAVKITACEVEIDLYLEIGRGWVEFRFQVFNGSLFPISLDDMSGFVSFSNGLEFRKLDGELQILPKLRAENCRRHQIAHFTLRQDLSIEDVAFISEASWSGSCFMFDQLVITVRGYGEALQDLPASRIATEADDVQPTLRAAFRHDAAALEAKRRVGLESRFERVRSLSEVIGRARELVRIHKDPQFIPLEDMKSLAREIETALLKCYGHKALEKFYPFDFKGERLEGPDQYRQGRVEWFIQYLNQLVVTEEREESEGVNELGQLAN
jgi:hypothetical protein